MSIFEEEDNSWSMSFSDVCLILMLAIVMTLLGKYAIKYQPDTLVATSRIDVFVEIDNENKVSVKCNGPIRQLSELTSIIQKSLADAVKVHVAIHGDKNIPLWYIVSLNRTIESGGTKDGKLVLTYDLLGGSR